MIPSSKVMIHDCSWGRRDLGAKNPFEVQEELDQLKQVNKRLLSIISERTGKTEEEVAGVTRSDSYFDAEEAINFGLASAVIDQETFGALLKEGV